MRLLTLEDQKKVMDIAYTTAKNNYKYSMKREDFKVIEGYQEGIYAWIGLNRLIETFGDEIKTLPHFEIGGASAQIASEVPKHTSDNLDKFIYDVQIGSNKYHIFAHSYLGYGGEQVSLTIHTKLLDQGKTETPCALKGTPFNITINGEIKQFTGTGDFDECYSLLSTHVFKKSENGKCGAYDCVFYDEKANECVPLPLKFDTIYAQGVPAKSTDFLEMKNKTMYITEYEEISRAFARDYTYQTARKHSPEWKVYPFMDIALLQQVITINFVKRGFDGIVKNLVLKADSTINGTEPQWTLGAVMEACSPTVSYNDSHKGITTAQIAFICIAGVVAVMLVIFVVFIIRRRNKSLESTKELSNLLLN
jgi:hypothetical protein